MLPPRLLLKPLPKTLPPKGFGAPLSWPKGEAPLPRLPLPKTEDVSDLEDAEAPNGEGEGEALANEARGLALELRNGEAVDAKPDKPELLKANSEVPAGLSAVGLVLVVVPSVEFSVLDKVDLASVDS